MLLYPPINVIKEKADSRYTLVIMAAKRARDLIEGKPVLIDTQNVVAISIAAEEIVEDKITYFRPVEEAQPEMEEEIADEIIPSEI